MSSSTGFGIPNPLFFIGVVENANDPRREGRVQVRAFGIHGTNKEIQAQDLPWATVIATGYDANVFLKLNAWVFGMFLDGRDAQQPMILGLVPTTMQEAVNPEATGWGTIPFSNGNIIDKGSTPDDIGQPTISRLARGEYISETYVADMEAGRATDVKIGGGNRSWSEPASAYAAEYPFNRVIETAQHSIELDDTPGHERIMINHVSGSYIQIDAAGNKTDKTVADHYDVNDVNHHVKIGGMSTVTIEGNSYVYVKGNKIEEIEGDLQTIVHGNHILGVGGQSNINAGDQMQIRAPEMRIDANAGTLAMYAEDKIQIEAGVGFYRKAPFIFEEATTSLQITAAILNVKASDQISILGSDVIAIDTTGEVGINGSKVYINDFVDMANGGGPAAAEAEPSKGAERADLPEPPAKSMSIAPIYDGPSTSVVGILGQDDTAEQDDSSESERAAETTNASETEVVNVTPGQYGALLDMIARGEVDTTSTSGYDTIAIAARPHAPARPITQMTIGEILAWQESIDARSGVYSEAAGRYQIVEDTLRGFDNDDYPNLQAAIRGGEGQTPLYERAGLSTGDLFSAENQDKLAITLLEGRGLKRFLAGSMTQREFHIAIAQEWAALSQVGKGPNGTDADMISHYESSKNSARVTLNTVRSVLQQIKAGGLQ